jgi:hypothetical protein
VNAALWLWTTLMLCVGSAVFLERARELPAASASEPAKTDCTAFLNNPKAFSWVLLTNCPSEFKADRLLLDGLWSPTVEGYTQKREGQPVLVVGAQPERIKIWLTSIGGFLVLVVALLPWVRKILLERALPRIKSSF